MKSLKEFNGSVLFLEEDHYVTQDILFVIQKLKNETQNGNLTNHLAYALGHHKRSVLRNGGEVGN